MKVLCTGSAGFIGSHVVDLLLKNGHTVWCIDDLSTGKRENLPSDVEFAKVNVASWYDLVAEFVDFEPEAVIHLAAQPSLTESVDNPIRDAHVNIMGTVNCLRAAQKIGAKKFVFASTSAVYSDERVLLSRLVEDTELNPQSPYGISKMAGEMYVKNLFPDGYTILRFGNVFGPRQVPLGTNQLIPHIIEHFEKGEKFYILGDGEQSRDFVYVEDVACAVLSALMTSTPCTCNIAFGNPQTVNSVAREIATIYGVPEYQFEHTAEQDPRRIVSMSIQKAKELLAWEPKVPIAEGLKRTVEWWQKRGNSDG